MLFYRIVLTCENELHLCLNAISEIKKGKTVISVVRYGPGMKIQFLQKYRQRKFTDFFRMYRIVEQIVFYKIGCRRGFYCYFTKRTLRKSRIWIRLVLSVRLQ